MPSADVVVIGAGLAGLTAAITRGRVRGARPRSWPRATRHPLGTRRDRRRRDPGRTRRRARASACSPLSRATRTPSSARTSPRPSTWIRPHLAAGGAEYLGDLDTPLQLVPTSIGGTRRAAILPAGQAAAARPWAPGERLVVCGVAGFKDFWPEAIAASLARERVWEGGNRPASVTPVSVALPGLADRHNLNALEIARRFDDPAWRAKAIEAMARAIDAVPGSGGRVALPAVLGIQDHAAALAAVRRGSPRGSVRDAARPAQRAGDAPLRGTPRSAPPGRRARPDRRDGRADRARGRPRDGRRVGRRRPHVHGSDRRPRHRHRRDRRRRAGRRARRPAPRGPPRTARGGPAGR